MIHFDDIYHIDVIFFKPKDKDPMNVPLCEVINGSLIGDKLTDETIVIKKTGDNTGKEPEAYYERKEFQKFIEKSLHVGEIEEIALQVEGEPLRIEVAKFLEKYENR